MKNENKKSYLIKISYIPRFCTNLFFFFNNLTTIIFSYIFKPNIIHYSYYNPFLSKFLNIPYVVTVHDLIHEKLFKGNFFSQRKAILTKATKIICISEETKKNLLKFYNIKKDKVSVIYHGVKINNRKSRKVKKNQKIFFFDRGRYKNFDIVVNAFNLSSYLKKNFQIICFGGGNFTHEENEKFYRLGVNKKILQMNGDDMLLKKYYRNSKVIVYSSKIEGFGIPLIEAMSNNCPIIANDIKIFREVIGNAGIFYNKNNKKDLKLKLEKLLKNKKLQDKIIKRGQIRVKKFDLNIHTKKHHDLYLNFFK